MTDLDFRRVKENADAWEQRVRSRYLEQQAIPSAGTGGGIPSRGVEDPPLPAPAKVDAPSAPTGPTRIVAGCTIATTPKMLEFLEKNPEYRQDHDPFSKMLGPRPRPAPEDDDWAQELVDRVAPSVRSQPAPDPGW